MSLNLIIKAILAGKKKVCTFNKDFEAQIKLRLAKWVIKDYNMKQKTPLFSIFVLSFLMFVSCSTSGKVSGFERDGLSIETAVIAKSIKHEYEWIRNKYPESKLQMQILTTHGSKHYDVFEIEIPSGETTTIYFDISGFYGKGF